jgi:hypothetical protein
MKGRVVRLSAHFYDDGSCLLHHFLHRFDNLALPVGARLTLALRYWSISCFGEAKGLKELHMAENMCMVVNNTLRSQEGTWIENMAGLNEQLTDGAGFDDYVQKAAPPDLEVQTWIVNVYGVPGADSTVVIDPLNGALWLLKGVGSGDVRMCYVGWVDCQTVIRDSVGPFGYLREMVQSQPQVI